ncbi:MAG: metal-dependent hydrolase [candidate division Zixibacteria bacterium]|nr:metal-dependent hydrolase [candidate division Zixibacteria bacterium]
MDNLTHTLFGAAVGRLFEDKLPRRVAFWTAAASSNFPDLDFVYRLDSAAKYFDLHRGFSHSVVGLSLEAVLVAGVIYLFVRQKFKWIFLVALMGSFGHTLLDLLNPYPTCALLPFTDRKFAWDLVFIVDPFIWLVLITALIWGRVKFDFRKGAALTALFVFSGYVTLRLFAHEGAAQKLLARPPVETGEKVRDWGVYPRPLEFWQWRYVLETDNNFYRGEVSLFADTPLPAARYAKIGENDYVAAAKESYLSRVFLRFARFPYLSLDHRGEDILVRWDDLRYAAPGEENFFNALVLVSPEKKIVELGAPPVLVKRVWQRVMGKWGSKT